ncbi:MAG: methyltransferase domain-containing protein [Balneolales bacterium]|nr:methyltransferase domain-containing protein [Balneolales bacterium]
MSTIAYLKSLLKDKNVASVTPSSSFTIKKTTRNIDFSKDVTIIEYGPGTGVFAEFLLKHISPGSRLIMIEMNVDFVHQLKHLKDDRVSVHHASAEQVEAIALEHGLQKVDYILSGIPFSFLDEKVKNRILAATVRLLHPEGIFLAYQTSSHLKESLQSHFSHVETCYEIRNIPPMCIYEARM